MNERFALITLNAFLVVVEEDAVNVTGTNTDATPGPLAMIFVMVLTILTIEYASSTSP